MRRFLPGILAFATLPVLTAQSSSVLDWTSYLSGDKTGYVRAVAVGPDGGIWVAGASATVFDALGPNEPFQRTPKGSSDVFVAKYRRDPSGQSTLTFWTWLGGSGKDDVRAMKVDSLGRVFLAGSTESTDFPAEGYFHTTTNAGGVDAWAAIIDETYSGKDSMVFCTMFGGTGTDVANAVAIDSAFNIYIAGYTTSEGLPGRSSPAQNSGQGGWEGFITKFDPSVSASLRYTTYFGGSSTDVITGLAVDNSGIVWFTGNTASGNFPVAGESFRDFPASGVDGFLVGLDLNRPGLDSIVYGTYIGGGAADYPKALSIAPDGTLWVTGYTYSQDLPTTANSLQRSLSLGADAFVMGVNPRLSRNDFIRYSSYLGGVGTDVPESVTVLGNGRIALTGYTNSRNFPSGGGPLQGTLNGTSSDGFVTIFNPAAASATESLEYSTFIGGELNDVATGVAVDASSVYVGGYTNSINFPSTGGGKNPNPAVNSGYLSRIAR
jgi:hypothetical protein